ncbi:unnamed protein product [Symbiodinium sp. CCMP2592]|nr:unnamed protein product [Symbiodinium sp. CCMP2592]
MAVEPNADEALLQVLSVDKFLYEDGVYAFSPERVELAKKLCFERLKLLVQSGQCRRIVCTCGCPGAGKSTWIAAHGREERAVFFDDLLYTARHRTQFLQNLKSYEIEVPVEIVAIERDFEAALASNSARPADRQVPLEAMQKFRDNYTRPGQDEGFCRVRVFSNSFEDKTGRGGFNLEVQAEALRQMQEEVSCKLPDLRSEGDSHWLANGAQVELHGLQKAQTLNGLRGEIIGFDDKQLRYRVRLHSDNTVKVVAKKNLRLLTLEDRVLFVETGTFLGQTVVALAAHFDELHTIEVDSKLFEAAKLASWKAAHPIHFHLGHSAHVLEKILPGLMGPAVFYLDAHYSGSVTGGAFSEVPLLEELVVLERQFVHAGLVVIDDMDLFSKVNFFERVSGKTGKSCGERASDWRPISCQSICRCFAAERVQHSFPTRSGNRYILCLGATASGKDSEPQLNTACLTYGAACPDLAWRSYGASHWLSVPGHPLNLDGLRRLRAEGPWWSSIADAMETEPGAKQKNAHQHRNSLGSSSTQFLEVVKQMSDARSETSKLCEKSVDVKLTRQQAIMMHDDLLEVYMEEGFQRRLEAAWAAAGEKRALQQKAKREVCLPLQMPIVAKYGFEPTEKGVFASLWSIRTTFFNFATEASMDVEMTRKAELMHFLVTPGAELQQHAAPAAQLSGSTRSLPAPSQSRDLVPAGAPQMPGPPAGRITREMVLKAVDRVKVDTVALQQRIAARQAGGGMTTSDICDVYLRLVASEESYREVKELYQSQNGRDEELELLGNAALESSEVVAEQYFEVRSWQEYFQDEVNVTKYSVKKHGILGTLKNEVVEVGNDVKDLGRGAATVVQTGREQVPHLVRAATDTMGNVVQTGSAAAASTGASFAARSQEHLTSAVHETVVAPVKRAWHLMATGFILCVLVPLFALRTYAPLNSVVSNLGLLWLLICTCCPPRGMNGRAGKSALLLLYPLITVVLPLALHYWATHPQLSQDVGDMFRRLPEQLGRIPEQLKELPGINKLRCSDNDQSCPTPSLRGSEALEPGPGS